MHRNGRIYVDFDDVLCETALEFTRVLEREFGKRVAFADICSFDLGRSFGLNAAEVGRLMHHLHEPHVLAAMEPVAGAVASVQAWADAGYDIWVVTGRPTRTLEASRAWLDRHGVPYAGLQFVDKYGRSDPDQDQALTISLQQLAQRPFCLAVEDAPEMVRFLAERTRVPVVMLARPWNTGTLELSAEGAGRVVRCADWAAITRSYPQPGRAGRRGGADS